MYRTNLLRLGIDGGQSTIKKIEGRVKDSHLQPHPFMVIEVVSMVFGFGNKVARNEDVFLSLTEGEKR